MWWLEMRRIARGLRPVVSLLAAGVLAGCFQPLYGTHTVNGGPNIKAALNGVDVAQIPAQSGTDESRIAVEVRNALLFAVTGGDAPAPPSYRLNVRLNLTRLSVIVDINTARPDVEDVGINATYELVELKTGKVVISDQTFSRVSYDIPGQQQRFARVRALREAENRAAQVIADNIRSRLASYFVAGT
jgi:LPS-assembly lipoprotein